MTTQVHLDFLGWRRSGLYANVVSATKTPEGRLRATAAVTLHNELPPNDSATDVLTFDIVGPGDVEALKAGAVVHMVPPPGSVDFEETKCPYIELAEADLPWRYTPELAAGPVLRPWIVLVVGTPQEVQLHEGTVTLTNAVLVAHDLTRSARWAHVQDDSDHPGQRLVARLLRAVAEGIGRGLHNVRVPAGRGGLADGAGHALRQVERLRGGAKVHHE